MQDVIAKFERVYIDRCSVDSRLARRVRELFPADRIEISDGRPMPDSQGPLSAREFSRSKRLLYLTQFKGGFFKRCPGARPGLACCNYFVLNWGLQCDMNCSYCYLQSFINTPTLTLYTNLDDALTELREMNGLHDQPVRVGTGETVDSLSLDELTLFSHDLIAFFRDYPRWTLEFKTKSDKVDHFLDIEHRGNIIVSWSVNPQNVVAREEHGTASLDARLDAAGKCVEKGFQISFHIDPMIWHPEWRESYAGLVDAITARFKPSMVPVMSVGALRFQPEQQAMMRERFGMNSYVTSAETFKGTDGKQRYDAKLRQEMFKVVMDRFKAHDPRWRIFMCMETPETWLKTEGALPFKSDVLKDLFKTIRLPQRDGDEMKESNDAMGIHS